MICNASRTFSSLPEDLLDVTFFVIEVQIDFSFCGLQDGSFWSFFLIA